MCAMKKKHDAEKFLHAMYNILFDARMCYDLWWICVSSEGRGKYFSCYSEYHKFFEVIGYSCITSMTISLYKMQETRTDTYNLKNLKECLGEEYSCNNVLVKKIEEKESVAKKTWIKICKLRSELFAHTNRASSRSEIYKAAKLRPNEIKGLTEQYLIILNMYAGVIGQPKTVFNDYTTQSTYELLDKLKDG